MLIGEVAAELLVSPSVLRKLKRQKRVPPATRDHNGWRRYDVEDLEAITRVLYPRPEPPRRRRWAPADLVWADLRLSHTGNGERWGPGRCQVPRDLLRDLLATEQAAART